MLIHISTQFELSDIAFTFANRKGNGWNHFSVTYCACQVQIVNIEATTLDTENCSKCICMDIYTHTYYIYMKKIIKLMILSKWEQCAHLIQIDHKKKRVQQLYLSERPKGELRRNKKYISFM